MVTVNVADFCFICSTVDEVIDYFVYVYFEFVHLCECNVAFCCMLSISGSRPVTMVVQAAVPNSLL